ncbi:MAG: LysE family translocator [Halofilum sp. (in: g-proteobacteria)]|nr:LysE family translocator [Halofilum sp. (in: g-proteobacteria)]
MTAPAPRRARSPPSCARPRRASRARTRAGSALDAHGLALAGRRLCARRGLAGPEPGRGDAPRAGRLARPWRGLCARPRARRRALRPATAAGLATAPPARPGLYRALALAGAGYLAWLGVGALRARGATADVSAPAARGLGGAARDGFTMALLNPKIAVFFLALFSQFVTPGAGAADTAILWATATVIDGAWYSLVAVGLTGSAALGWLRARGALIDRATGLMLLALAAWTVLEVLARG